MHKKGEYIPMDTNPTFLERYSLLLFLFLTPLLSLAIPVFLPLPPELVPLTMVFVPALMAILLTAMTGGRKSVGELLKKLFQWWAGFRWYAITLGLALGLRLAMSLLAVLLGWIPAVALSPWSLQEFIIIGVFIVIGAVSEELGWRGYALPMLLAHRPALSAALIIGVPWGVLHLGLILPGQMNAGAHWLPSILYIIGLSVILTWLYIQTRASLAMPILFHAAQSYFVFLNGGITLTQQLWLLTIVSIVIALILTLLYSPGLQRSPVKTPAAADAAQVKKKEIAVMNVIHSSTDLESISTRTKHRTKQVLRIVQLFSRLVTLVFLAALIWAIYQAVVKGNALPLWAWLGLTVLLAVAIGLGVAAIVYRGVVKEVGPFDFRQSTRVTGELINETQAVNAGGASSLRAEFNMLQGNLQISGGAAQAMEAEFTYDDADWKPPVVKYDVNAESKGELVVEQKGTGRPAMRQGRCEWVIRLSQDLPTELDVKFGAGKADLRLGGLALDRLRVESGVGELALDLSGEWRNNIVAFVKTGIGDTVVRLPQNIGVRVQSSVGFGSTHPHGLAWDGEAYTNALYGQTETTLDITIDGGIGKISLEETNG